MIKIGTLASVIGLSVVAAACSAGGPESGQTEQTAPTEATPAPATTDMPSATDPGKPDSVALASLTGNAAAGKLLFTQCRACHVTDAGVNKIGPSLNGIIGAKAGSVAGFNYSPANASSGIIWTKEKLFQFLEKPQRVIPKTKMIFAGLPDAQKRADLIAYLENPK